MTDRSDSPPVLALPAPAEESCVDPLPEPRPADPCEDTGEILPLSRERASVASRLACAAVAALLVLAAAWVAGALLPATVEGVRAIGWPEVEADLLHAGLGHDVDFGSSSLDDTGDHEWLELRYAYFAAAPDLPGMRRAYTGARFDASTGLDDGRKHEASPARLAYVDHVTRSAPRIRVRYDPAHPERSLVLPGIPYGLLGGWLCVVTLLLAARPLALHGTRTGAVPTFGGGRKTVGHGERTGAEVCGALVFAFLTFTLWATWAIGWGAWMPGAPPVLPVALAIGYGVVYAVAGEAIPARIAGVVNGAFGLVLVVAGVAAVGAGFLREPVEVTWEPTHETRSTWLVSPHRDVRLTAIRAFGRDGGPDGAADTVRAMTSDPDPGIARAARLALARRR